MLLGLSVISQCVALTFKVSGKSATHTLSNEAPCLYMVLLAL